MSKKEQSTREQLETYLKLQSILYDKAMEVAEIYFRLTGQGNFKYCKTITDYTESNICFEGEEHIVAHGYGCNEVYELDMPTEYLLNPSLLDSLGEVIKLEKEEADKQLELDKERLAIEKETKDKKEYLRLKKKFEKK